MEAPIGRKSIGSFESPLSDPTGERGSGVVSWYCAAKRGDSEQLGTYRANRLDNIGGLGNLQRRRFGPQGTIRREITNYVVETLIMSRGKLFAFGVLTLAVAVLAADADACRRGRRSRGGGRAFSSGTTGGTSFTSFMPPMPVSTPMPVDVAPPPADPNAPAPSYPCNPCCPQPSCCPQPTCCQPCHGCGGCGYSHGCGGCGYSQGCGGGCGYGHGCGSCQQGCGYAHYGCGGCSSCGGGCN